MKTILVTGGTSGIGKGIAMHYLKKGDCVIVVGSSSAKGETFYEEAKKLGAQDRAIYLKADLSLVKENRRIIEEVRGKFSSLDALILCAQYQKNKAIMHGSRLNDLLGVSFAANNKETKIKYILINPGAVQTSGAMEAFENPVMKAVTKMLYKVIGKPVEKAVKPIIKLLENPPAMPLAAFMQTKEVSLAMETFNKDNAQRLYKVTQGLIQN